MFAPSFQSIVFALHQFDLNELEIISNTEAVGDFCKLAGIKHNYFPDITDASMQGHFNYRKGCEKIIDAYNGKEILFGFHTYEIWGLWILRNLKKRNKVFFYNVDYLSKEGFNDADSIEFPSANNPFRFWYSSDYRKRFLRRLFFFRATGWYYDLIRMNKNYFAPGMLLRKCRKKFIRYEPKPHDFFQSNLKLLMEKFHIPTPDIIWIDGGDEEMSFPNEVIEVIKNFSTENSMNLILKPHPSWAPPKELSSIQQMEKRFPVELLKGVPQMVLGVGSNALVNFSSVHKVVSLIHLAKFEHEESRNYLLKFIEGKNIICPKTISELEEEFKKLF